MKLSTIHIFAYGEAQIISDTVNFKTGVTNFTTLQAVIDDVKSKKPSDVTVQDYHAINIFNDMRVDYNSTVKGGSFSVPFATLDATKLKALTDEFTALKAAYDIAHPKA